MLNNESFSGSGDKDPVFTKALENYQRLNARLEGADSYEKIIDAIERAAVNDGEDEMVLFDIIGYVEGYEDEELDATTVPLEKLRKAILQIKEKPTLTYDEIRQLLDHIPVRNAVIAVWALEDKNQTDE
jgi:integrase